MSFLARKGLFEGHEEDVSPHYLRGDEEAHEEAHEERQEHLEHHRPEVEGKELCYDECLVGFGKGCGCVRRVVREWVKADVKFVLVFVEMNKAQYEIDTFQSQE